MLFTDFAFIGITPNTSRKSFAYAALDRNLNLLALVEGELNEIVAFIADRNFAIVAINSPSSINRGLVRELTKKKTLTPAQVRRVELRLAEHIMREHGIAVTKTPASAALCPAWMQAGLELYRKLEKMEFQKYPEKDAPRQILETNPLAGYSVLVGQLPAARTSLEGRLQRQLILYESGMRVKDPMDFFEEITRHKMSKGIWPVELLYLPDQLDALVAAYTAWLAMERQNQISCVGDAREGQIFVPAAELKDKY
ncbi:MAG: DUF429 domain-containing protein [Anaerolineales bacterium]|uniref:DUF429 domain-containing protein n=1 Tax=Candidatus Villigracilis proximus TaxID=3140683 RepID=UPI003135E509|nr:DUF429 domain-containing protein [Anaerolineales bacterium]